MKFRPVGSVHSTSVASAVGRKYSAYRLRFIQPKLAARSFAASQLTRVVFTRTRARSSVVLGLAGILGASFGVFAASAAAASVLQAPVQLAAVQLAPVQLAALHQAPVQQAPVQLAAVQQASVQQASVQQASVQQAPVVVAAKNPGVLNVGDHWHIAFGVYVCDKFVKLPESTGKDPLGIHTHGDGLIHAHPFSEKAAGKNATMARFFETEKMTVTLSEIKLGTTTYLSGKDCGGKKTKLSVLRWKSRTDTSPEVVSGDASKIALVDQQMIVFAIAPEGTKIAAPPSKDELTDPADLPPPPLKASELPNLPAPPSPIPGAVMNGTPPTNLVTKDFVEGKGAEAKKGSLVYVRYTMSLWRTKSVIAKSTWGPTEQPEALSRLGRGRLLPGLDKGLIGMKIGGIRQITMPPADGFGTAGNSEIRGTDTLVMVAQLVAIR